MPSPQERIRDEYGFDFPEDFFGFPEFVAALPPGELEEVCHMQPAYPFALAAGVAAEADPDGHQWKDRYYSDLPGFITLFHGDCDGSHWGYFFDAPGEHPPVVAHYWHSDSFDHGIEGDNLFEAVRHVVEYGERDHLDMIRDDPGAADTYRETLTRLAAIRATLSRFWDADRPETGLAYLNRYDGSAWRKAVAPTWSGLGIRVPRKQFRRLSADPFSRPDASGRVNPKRKQIQSLTAEAVSQLEAGQPGAALKLGHDLWVWAADFPECYELLDAAYRALGREALRRRLAEARAHREWCDRQQVD